MQLTHIGHGKLGTEGDDDALEEMTGRGRGRASWWAAGDCARLGSQGTRVCYKGGHQTQLGASPIVHLDKF